MSEPRNLLRPRPGPSGDLVRARLSSHSHPPIAESHPTTMGRRASCYRRAVLIWRPRFWGARGHSGWPRDAESNDETDNLSPVSVAWRRMRVAAHQKSSSPPPSLTFRPAPRGTSACRAGPGSGSLVHSTESTLGPVTRAPPTPATARLADSTSRARRPGRHRRSRRSRWRDGGAQCFAFPT